MSSWDLLLNYSWCLSGERVPKALFDIFAGSIASPCLKSSLCQLVCSPTRRSWTIYHNTHYRHNFILQKAAFFFLCETDVSGCFLSKVFWCYAESVACKQSIFRAGKSFILLKLSTQAFLSISQKLRKKKCYVAFQPISQLQYWAKRYNNRPVIFSLSALCSPGATQSPFQMDQLTMIHLSYCLHFHPLVHLSVHLFTRVLQRAAFPSEKRVKEQKRREKGQGVWSRAEPYPSDTKAHSDPWNTTQSQPSAPLGPGSK